MICVFVCFVKTVPSPPSNLSVSQNGLSSVLVCWAPSHGADFYTVYYQRDGDRRQSQTAEAGDTSITLSLIVGETYSISMIANTELSSTEAGPVNITIGIIFHCILVYHCCDRLVCLYTSGSVLYFRRFFGNTGISIICRL